MTEKKLQLPRENLVIFVQEGRIIDGEGNIWGMRSFEEAVRRDAFEQAVERGETDWSGWADEVNYSLRADFIDQARRWAERLEELVGDQRERPVEEAGFSLEESGQIEEEIDRLLRREIEIATMPAGKRRGR